MNWTGVFFAVIALVALGVCVHLAIVNSRGQSVAVRLSWWALCLVVGLGALRLCVGVSGMVPSLAFARGWENQQIPDWLGGAFIFSFLFLLFVGQAFPVFVSVWRRPPNQNQMRHLFVLPSDETISGFVIVAAFIAAIALCDSRGWSYWLVPMLGLALLGAIVVVRAGLLMLLYSLTWVLARLFSPHW